MAKESGLGWEIAARSRQMDVTEATAFQASPTLFTDPESAIGTLTEQDIKGDVGNVTFTTPRNPGDVTGLDKYAMEKLLLLADYTSDWSGFFNDATNRAHLLLRTVPSDQRPRMEVLSVSGNVMRNIVIVTDYSITRGADGSLNWSSPGMLASGHPPVWA